MKNTTSNHRPYKLIASHALVIAVVTAPYFVGLWGDIYNLAKIGLASLGMPTTIAEPVVMSETQRMSMSFLSGTAFLIAAITFVVYLVKRRK